MVQQGIDALPTGAAAADLSAPAPSPSDQHRNGYAGRVGKKQRIAPENSGDAHSALPAAAQLAQHLRQQVRRLLRVMGCWRH